MENARLVKRGTYPVLDILGPTIEFLVPPQDNAGYCVMVGTLPPHGSVPLHSHPDAESFYLVSGSIDVLTESDGGFEWLPVRRGQFIAVPGGTKHAYRNSTNEPAVQLITTTSQLGKFFLDVGRPADSAHPPSLDEIRRFTAAAARYGHWLGSKADNQAVGILLAADFRA